MYDDLIVSGTVRDDLLRGDVGCAVGFQALFFLSYATFL